jgi:2,4-dienoyl-CoA reductase-like NADH-dependent reductase (Old Yellow Enzyme family)
MNHTHEDITPLLQRYITDWSNDERGLILFEEAIDYLVEKHGDNFGTITSKEPTFWAWWKRIVEICDRQLISIMIQSDNEKMDMKEYRESIRIMSRRYKINKAVTYQKHSVKLVTSKIN